MARKARYLALVVIAMVLALALATVPALGHEGHAGHEGGDSGPSFWPYLFGVGTVAAAGSVAVGYVTEVEREFAIGFAAGGLALATGAAIVWLL